MLLTIAHGATDDSFYGLVLLAILVYIAFVAISLSNTTGKRLSLWIVNTIFAILLLPIMIFILLFPSPVIIIPIIYIACLVVHIRAFIKRRKNAKTV
jgi:predicted neutral ceramidase superfamily lipid hydrolase